MPCSCARPNQNHTRLISMPMPEAMNTTLYAGMSGEPPNMRSASQPVRIGATRAPALMPM